ncbi:hypothetical protein [Actinomadura miaoliensis]|uniref:Uncharacterized protein n=1 Tax=Actinomadura miaoliensis TaxID=430685 RepID=A0ABP7W1J7_9ACTN
MKGNVAVGGLAVVGAGMAWRRLARRKRARDAGSRWLAVTVNCAPERLSPEPEPMARIRDIAEVTTRPAPGGRGTELAARLLDPRSAGKIRRLTGTDPRLRVRTALRDAKSLVETGEVLLPDAPPTTHPPSPAGKVLDVAIRRAGGEGRL